MSFSDILGNSRVKNILRKGLQRKRIPNSLLFVGPEGVGKFDAAMELAKALNCLEKTDDACDKCGNCRAIKDGNFPDVLVLSPENGNIKIEQMRLLKQTAYLKPMIGKKRVFVVDQAEQMKSEGANSLLKILEEPPLFSHIVLTTKNPFLILPTIKSRCQVLTFSPVSREDIERVLIERGHEETKARLLSLLVRGNLKQAMNVNWEEVQAKREISWGLFKALVRGENAAEIMKNFSSGGKGLREELEGILAVCVTLFRDTVLIREVGDSPLLMNPDYSFQIREMTKEISPDQALRFMKHVEYAVMALQKKSNVNLLVSSLFSNFMEREYV